MKSSMLNLVLVSAAVGFCFAEESASPSTLLVPSLAEDWQPVPSFESTPEKWPTDPATSSHAPTDCVIPLHSGVHGLFRRHFDPDIKRHSTRVYLSNNREDFGFRGKHADALHMVADFPHVLSKVIRHENQWFAVKSVMGKASMIRLEWSVHGIPTPAAAHAKPIKVALYHDVGTSGKGVPACLSQLSGQRDVQVTKLDAASIRQGLSGYHVVIFSGGSAIAQANHLGLAGREQVRRFVEAGGGYIGICAGAHLACDGAPWALKILNAKPPSALWQRGRAHLVIESTATGQDLLKLPPTTEVLYNNGPILAPAKNADLPEFETLAIFKTEVSQDSQQHGLQVNTAAIARGRYGQGKVLVSSPHMEQTSGMERWISLAVDAAAP